MATLLEGKKKAKASLGRVCILGLGKSGRSAARYCANLLGERISELYIAAGAPNEANEAFLAELTRPGISYRFGDDALIDQEGFDLCIASPGIPFWHELYQDALAKSSEVISEVCFAWRESEEESIWIAITGTNGKTTTTALCASILSHCGLKAAAVGNIGEVCLDAVATGQTSVYVAEVSSYQLASKGDFAPDVAMILNITPDHLHWHRTHEAYREAKLGVLDGLASREAALPSAPSVPVAVLGALDPEVRTEMRRLRTMTREERGFDYIPLGTADGIAGDMRQRCGADAAAFMDDSGELIVAFDGIEHRLGKASELSIAGVHNVANALAAASAAVILGCADDAIAEALADFQPLEHRMEPCGVVAGVTFVNDSKATNVDAVVKALSAYPDHDAIIMLGGEDKGTDLDPLVEAVLVHAKAAVCYGEASRRIHDAFIQAGIDPAFQLRIASGMADALDTARTLASSGDTILLSPACASFDEFNSFEERGRVFKDLVSALGAR